MSVSTILDDSLAAALAGRGSCEFLLAADAALVAFVDGVRDKKEGSLNDVLLFPPLEPSRRHLIHTLSKRYRMLSGSVGAGAERRVALQLTNRSRVPILRLADFVCASSGQLPPPTSYYGQLKPASSTLGTASVSNGNSRHTSTGTAAGSQESEETDRRAKAAVKQVRPGSGAYVPRHRRATPSVTSEDSTGATPTASSSSAAHAASTASLQSTHPLNMIASVKEAAQSVGTPPAASGTRSAEEPAVAPAAAVATVEKTSHVGKEDEGGPSLELADVDVAKLALDPEALEEATADSVVPAASAATEEPTGLPTELVEELSLLLSNSQDVSRLSGKRLKQKQQFLRILNDSMFSACKPVANTPKVCVKHILEVFGFPPSHTTADLEACFLQYQSFGGVTIRWWDDTHALAVFANPELAAHALKESDIIETVHWRPLQDDRLRDLARLEGRMSEPAPVRPAKSATVAQRLVLGSLGIRRPPGQTPSSRAQRTANQQSNNS